MTLAKSAVGGRLCGCFAALSPNLLGEVLQRNAQPLERKPQILAGSASRRPISQPFNASEDLWPNQYDDLADTDSSVGAAARDIWPYSDGYNVFQPRNHQQNYCRRANYRVQTLKTTDFVDTESQAVLDAHCTTKKRHDTQPRCRQRPRWHQLRDKLREEGLRPLIKHREFRPIDHAHNARIDGTLYRQRALSGTVFLLD